MDILDVEVSHGEGGRWTLTTWIIIKEPT
jgi:hypothetical protein